VEPVEGDDDVCLRRDERVRRLARVQADAEDRRETTHEDDRDRADEENLDQGETGLVGELTHLNPLSARRAHSYSPRTKKTRRARPPTPARTKRRGRGFPRPLRPARA